MLKAVVYHYLKIVKLGKSLNLFFFSYIWNWTLQILVNEGISLKAFMDIIVKKVVTKLIKVTVHKTFKDRSLSE